MLNFTTTKDQKLNFVRALVYGDSGTGKTTSIGTLPEKGTLLITTERGTLPLRDKSYITLQVKTWSELENVIDELAASETDQGIQISVEGKDQTIHTVVFDSLTAIERLCVRHIIEEDRATLVKERDSNAKKGAPKGIYEDCLTQEDYKPLYRRIESLLTTINELPINTVCTCLSKWRTDKHDKSTIKALYMEGANAVTVTQFFDIIVHMETPDIIDFPNIKEKRIWRTFNDGKHICKDSSGNLAEIEKCNWTELFKKVKGK